ncbi:unnamed protein product [Symbiodinium sp. CCMP2456]|nr:unnamed protein product [Symbiodinium sp. CCMP2456]
MWLEATVSPRCCIKARTSALSACRKNASWERAFHLLRAISTDGLRLNLIPINAVISVCEKSGRWCLGALLHRGLRDHLLKPDVITVNSAISACEKANLWQPALRGLASAQQWSIETDSITFNAAMAACEKGDRWQDAVKVLKDMCRARRAPSAISFGTAASACGRGEEWRWSFELLSELRRNGLEATVVVFGAAITALENDVQWSRSLALLAEVQNVRLEANVVIYSATISVMERSRMWQYAIALLKDMELSEVQANVIPYNSAISALSHASRWQLAIDYLAFVTDSSIELNVVTLAAATTACDRAGNWQQALHLLVRAVNENLSNVVSFGAAVSACEKNEEWQWALDLLSSLLAQSLEVNGVVFSAAISACAKASMWRHGLALYSRALSSGVDRDVALTSSAISAAGEGHSWRRSVQFLTELHFQEQTLNLVAYNSAMATFRVAGQWREVIHLFQDMERDAVEVDAIARGVAVDACANAIASPQASALLMHLQSGQLCRLQEVQESRRPKTVNYEELVNKELEQVLDGNAIHALRTAKAALVMCFYPAALWLGHWDARLNQQCRLNRFGQKNAEKIQRVLVRHLSPQFLHPNMETVDGSDLSGNTLSSQTAHSDDDAASFDSLEQDSSLERVVEEVRLELYPEKSTDSDEDFPGDFADGPCCVRGQWSPDGGPGMAQNPQVQLGTTRVSEIRAELRAKLLEPNSTLELWLLQGTRWGKRVKQLASEEKEEEEGDAKILKKGMTKRGQTRLKARKSGQCRVYKILTSAQSSVQLKLANAMVTHFPGPLRVMLEIEVKAKESLTFVLTRGRHQLQQDGHTMIAQWSLKMVRPENHAAMSGSETSFWIGEWKSSRQLNHRQSTGLEEPPSPRRGSVRVSVGSGAAPNQALNKMTSRNSIVSNASSSKKSPTAGRRSSVGRRGSQTQTILPVLPVANLDELEGHESKTEAVKLVTVAPEILTRPEKALVRNWNPEEDYFELRIWGSSPLRRGPKLVLTAADKAAKHVPRRDRRWEGTVRTFARTFGNLEGAHEESWSAACSNVARHARFGLNEQLDAILAALRRMRAEDTDRDPDFFKYCPKHCQPGLMILDCVGKELGTPARY